MKKLLVLIIALAMTLSLVACGGGDKPASSAAPSSAAPSSAAPSSAAASSAAASSAAPKSSSQAEVDFTPEQQALAQEYLEMCEKYDEAVDKVNSTPVLLENTELVDTMNELADAIIEADEYFANPKDLTAEVMANLKEAIKQTHVFIEEVNKAADTATEPAAESIVVPVEVINDTGVDIHGLAMSPANSQDWGENLLTAPLAYGESGVSQMSFTQDTLVWDLLVEDAQGNQLSFMGIDFSEANVEGAKLVLSVTEGGAYMAMFVE